MLDVLWRLRVSAMHVCLPQGMARAKAAGFVDWHRNPGSFDAEAYLHYEQARLPTSRSLMLAESAGSCNPERLPPAENNPYHTCLTQPLRPSLNAVTGPADAALMM